MSETYMRQNNFLPTHEYNKTDFRKDRFTVSRTEITSEGKVANEIHFSRSKEWIFVSDLLVDTLDKKVEEQHVLTTRPDRNSDHVYKSIKTHHLNISYMETKVINILNRLDINSLDIIIKELFIPCY